MSESIGFRHALLVEDEPQLADTIKLALSKLGITVEHASSLRAARSRLKTARTELLILDRNLPDGDGLTLCALADRAHTHILVLSALGETPHRIEGLDAGADDYLPKPFSFAELEARLRALARRRDRSTAIPGEPIEKSADAVWTLQKNRLRVHGPQGWRTLTPLEFKFLERLMRSEGEIVSREALLKEVWGFSLLPKTRTVDVFLARMRRYFEKDPESPLHFETHRGAGYTFKR